MIELFHENCLQVKLESKITLRIISRTVSGYAIGIDGPRGGYVASFDVTDRELDDLKKWLRCFTKPIDGGTNGT